MSAAEALKAAREAGIELELEGDDLVWEADEAAYCGYSRPLIAPQGWDRAAAAAG